MKYLVMLFRLIFVKPVLFWRYKNVSFTFLFSFLLVLQPAWASLFEKCRVVLSDYREAKQSIKDFSGAGLNGPRFKMPNGTIVKIFNPSSVRRQIDVLDLPTSDFQILAPFLDHSFYSKNISNNTVQFRIRLSNMENEETYKYTLFDGIHFDQAPLLTLKTEKVDFSYGLRTTFRSDVTSFIKAKGSVVPVIRDRSKIPKSGPYVLVQTSNKSQYPPGFIEYRLSTGELIKNGRPKSGRLVDKWPAQADFLDFLIILTSINPPWVDYSHADPADYMI